MANFEESVRQTRDSVETTVPKSDSLGVMLEGHIQRARSGLDTEYIWNSRLEDHDFPDFEPPNFDNHLEQKLETVQSLEDNLEAVEQVRSIAKDEAQQSRENLIDPNSAKRALESDQKATDYLKSRGLEALERSDLAEIIDDSGSLNSQRIESRIDELEEDIESEVNIYRSTFSNFMNEAASHARENYGALAELVDTVVWLDDFSPGSEVGEATIEQTESTATEALRAQADLVSDIYSEMMDAYDEARQVHEGLESSDYGMGLSRELSRAEEIFEQMSGNYDNFIERAEAMLEEGLPAREEYGELKTWNRPDGVTE